MTRQAIDNTANTGREEIARLKKFFLSVGWQISDDGQLASIDFGRWGTAIRLEALVAALTTPRPILSEAGWQPIETAPKDGARVLVWVDCATIEASFDHVASEWIAGSWGLGFGNSPTHWHPLPAPPLKTHLPEQEERG